MKKRIILLAGLGIGFVLGSRAGRQSYEKLKNQAASVWNDPKVQEGVHRAAETVKEQAPVVAEKVKEAAPVVAEKAKEAGTKVGEAASDAASSAKDRAADAKGAAQDKAAEAKGAGKDKPAAKQETGAAAKGSPSAAKHPASSAKATTGKDSTAASAQATGTEPASDRRSAPDGRNEDVVPEGPTKSNNLAPAVLPDVASDPEGQMDSEGPDASYIHGQEGKA
ncbi:hypothetical protein [Brevibacterium rongguiense]|uniref:hypothetical protein n=1 Tax=Brevibacterium rongguiense TaxID=2695267 RepID=UPI00192802B7|nr:hypothetical protein [Brevibacterium rongguiense]